MQPDRVAAKRPGPVAAMRAFANAALTGVMLGAAAFVIGFAFGILRVVLIAPAIGPVGALLLELSIFLPLLWWGSGRICDSMAVTTRNARFMVGLTALAVLLSLEVWFALSAVKMSLQVYLAGIATPAGLVGLSGQLMLAWLPALHEPIAQVARPPASVTRQSESIRDKQRERKWSRFPY